MDVEELAQRSIGEDLDHLMNLDPRGYGLCRLLYEGTREFMGEPAAMKCAKAIEEQLGPDDIVYLITGFVLLPHKQAEMDGIVASLLLARMLVKAYDAKPVIICPSECERTVSKLAGVVGLHVYDRYEDIASYPVSLGRIVFTKQEEEAEEQADEILRRLPPKAVIAIEAPGANWEGVYHNSKGYDLSELEAKSDILFLKCKEAGVLNIAIGDLGNELGMGSIASYLCRHIPFMEPKGCKCGCHGGAAALVGADYIITATVSHWGVEALICAIAWIKRRPDWVHSKEMEQRAIMAASDCGMVDMSGWLEYAIDGIGMEFHISVLELMRQCVENVVNQAASYEEWFEKVAEKNYIKNFSEKTMINSEK